MKQSVGEVWWLRYSLGRRYLWENRPNTYSGQLSGYKSRFICRDDGWVSWIL